MKWHCDSIQKCYGWQRSEFCICFQKQTGDGENWKCFYANGVHTSRGKVMIIGIWLSNSCRHVHLHLPASIFISCSRYKQRNKAGDFKERCKIRKSETSFTLPFAATSTKVSLKLCWYNLLNIKSGSKAWSPSGPNVLCKSGPQLNSIMQEDIIDVIVMDWVFIATILRLQQFSITC